MFKRDSLGDRMKNFYEGRSEAYLTRRMPVIIRIDGRAFHQFTKHFKKPYDKVFHKSMNKTMQYLCKNTQGCKLGYTQSDEISLLLTDYDTLDTDAFFDYRIQKMVSISASMATMAFNKFFAKETQEWLEALSWFGLADEEIASAYRKAIAAGAMFDARAFNIPKEEVTNYFIWRQQDATRNAIQMLGQTYYSHKELDKKSCKNIQEMLFQDYAINFNDMPVEFKRGVGSRKIGGFKLDYDIPIWTQNREYIEKLVEVE